MTLAVLVIFLLAAVDRHFRSIVFGSRTTEQQTAKPNALTTGLTNLAVLLAGKRRAYVREAWQSDLQRPRDQADTTVSGPRRIAYSAGLVRAGCRYRIDDTAAFWWRLADSVLGSRCWSRVVLVSPTAMAVALIIQHGGLYGLVVNADNLIMIATASASLIYGGRKTRKITPPPRRSGQEEQT